MTKPFQAVYESGMLRPLEPLPFGDHEIVTLIVANGDASQILEENGLEDDLIGDEAIAVGEGEGDAEISLEQLHELLKSIPGSMSDVVIEERGEY